MNINHTNTLFFLNNINGYQFLADKSTADQYTRLNPHALMHAFELIANFRPAAKRKYNSYSCLKNGTEKRIFKIYFEVIVHSKILIHQFSLLHWTPLSKHLSEIRVQYFVKPLKIPETISQPVQKLIHVKGIAINLSGEFRQRLKMKTHEDHAVSLDLIEAALNKTLKKILNSKEERINLYLNVDEEVLNLVMLKGDPNTPITLLTAYFPTNLTLMRRLNIRSEEALQIWISSIQKINKT